MKAIVQAARSALHAIPYILIVGLMALLPQHVLAAQAPEIERGLSWLKQQVQADGTLAGEGASVATPHQVRTESHSTLKRLATVPAALTAAITSAEEDTTEHLVRGILTRVEAGQDTSVAITRLSARRNADGGYGGDLGFASNPLDTAWTLLAYRAAGLDGDVAGALAYLQGAQGDDGAYHVDGKPDTYVTAVVLQALRAHASRYELSLQTARASAYLQSLQDADGTWEGDIGMTAQVYLALHDFVDYEPLATRIKAALVALQSMNGSWGDDVYDTALALRALHESLQPPASPVRGVIRGVVTDARTDHPIQGAVASLNPSLGAGVVTGSDGIFEMRDIPAGNYSLAISAQGYGLLNLSVQVSRDETKLLGNLALQPPSDVTTGLIRGTASDAYSGQTLSGVDVTVLDSPYQATTGLNGSYQITNMPAGEVRIIVSKAGYTTTTAIGTVAAGGVLLFSPVMAPGSAIETAIEGRATDASTGLPLPGVRLAISSNALFSATTDADGKYRIAGLTAGAYVITAEAQGYLSAMSTITLSDGATGFYSPQLVPIGAPSPVTAKISGLIKDTGNGTPIAEADITLMVAGVGVFTSRSDQSGHFAIANPGGDTAVIKVEKSGYKVAFIQIYIQPGSSLHVGEIRLIAEDASTLLPDFRVKTIQRLGMATDPHSLQLSGSIGAVIENAGHAASAASSRAIAFYDANLNAIYDSGTDAKLGETSFSVLAPGQTMAIQLALEGALPYRDAPVRIWVDSEQANAEIDENNNIASTANAEECTTGRTLLYEDFNDGIADGWQPLGYFNTPAQIINGEYVRTSYGSSWIGDMNWTDYRAEIKLRFPNGMVNDGALAFRVRGTSVGEWMQVSINGGLVRFFYGSSVIAATYIQTSSDPNYWYTIAADMVGRSGRIDVNGQTLFNIDSLGWDTGAVGTIQDGVLVHYDDLRVTGVSGPYDISTSRVQLVDKGATGTEVSVRVGNGGSHVIPAGTTVSVFANEVSTATHLGSVTLEQPLGLEEWRDVTWLYGGDLGAVSRLIVVADADAAGKGQLTECDEANNRTDLLLTPGSILPDLVFGLSTDNSNYPSNSPVRLTANISNQGRYPSTVSVGFTIQTAEGTTVAAIPIAGPSSIQAGASATLTGQWNTGNAYSGAYQALAIYYDPQGRELARQTAPFSIVGGPAVLATQLVTDKSAYAQDETVRITGRVVNTSGNRLLGGLSLNETLLRPDGVSLDLGTRALPELAPGNASEQVFTHRLNPAPVGSYTVTQTVLDTTGTVLDSRQTGFEVRSGALTGAGLTGTLVASPHEVALGAQVNFTYNLSNQGNALLTGLPVTVRLLDPATQTVVAEFPLTLDLAIGGNHAGNLGWTAIGRSGDTLVAVLVATLAGTERVLAQDTLTLAGPAVDLALDVRLDPDARVLVLAACAGHGEGPEHDHRAAGQRGQASQHHPVRHGGCGQCERDCDEEGDGHDDDDSHGGHCGLGRAQALDALLDGLDIAHRVTTDPAVFRAELRSGAYNVYWLSGKIDKLKDDLAQEIREAVYRGGGLIQDGVHDERNKTFDVVAGIVWRGKLGARDQNVWLVDPPFDPLVLPSLGRGLKVQLAGGDSLGRFGDSRGQPAIVGHAYGQGQSLLFGFDLATSLDAGGDWPTQIGHGIAHVTPPADAGLTPGAWLPVVWRVVNRGAAVDAGLRVSLPPGSVYVGAEPAPESAAPGASVLDWRFPLAEHAEQVIRLDLRAPDAAVDIRLSGEAGAWEGGTFTPYVGPVPLDLTLSSGGGALATLATQIANLPVNRSERSRRDYATVAVRAAQADWTAGRWQDVIDHLIDATDGLLAIASLDTTSLRLGLDLALKEAQYRWAVANAQ